jgi:hypothetical protein
MEFLLCLHSDNNNVSDLWYIAKTLALRDVIDHISCHVLRDMMHSQNQVTDHLTDDVTHS